MQVGSLDGPFDDYNDGKLKRLLFGGLLEYTDGEVIGSDLGTKWDYLMVKCLTIYLEIYMESHSGLMLE